MPRRFPGTDQPPAFILDDAYRVLDALGPMPVETLAAMVDYGLDDAEIARYFDLPRDMIATLRAHWRITGNR